VAPENDLRYVPDVTADWPRVSERLP